MLKKFHKGFTLIELLMVLIVIAILAAFAIPRYFDLAMDARISASKASLGAIRSAISAQYAQNVVTAGAGGGPAFPSTLSASMFKEGEVPKEVISSGAGSAAVALTVVDLSVSGNVTGTTGGWIYNATTGLVRVNTTTQSANTF